MNEIYISLYIKTPFNFLIGKYKKYCFKDLYIYIYIYMNDV